jgi:hypothetical protein
MCSVRRVNAAAIEVEGGSRNTFSATNWSPSDLWLSPPRDITFLNTTDPPTTNGNSIYNPTTVMANAHNKLFFHAGTNPFHAQRKCARMIHLPYVWPQ